jgi:hypothetical protein
MAIGVYLTFNPPAPELQLQSDGKLLGTHLEFLEQLAETAGVPSLGAYMDQRAPADDAELRDFDAFMASWQEWFAPAAGIRTVEALLSMLRGPPPLSAAGGCRPSAATPGGFVALPAICRGSRPAVPRRGRHVTQAAPNQAMHLTAAAHAGSLVQAPCAAAAGDLTHSPRGGQHRMATVEIRTARLTLMLQTPDEVLAQVAALSPADRAEVSPDWIARVPGHGGRRPVGAGLYSSRTGERIGGRWLRVQRAAGRRWCR